MITAQITPENVIILLGAADPEMEAIEKIALHLEFQVHRMEGDDGNRCHPGNAYKGMFPYTLIMRAPIFFIERQSFLFIECGHVTQGQSGMVIDHHRRGDPGYGKGPTEFWEASSIGQFVEAVGLSVEEASEIVGTNVLAVAASDHCLAEAYRGNCPGVTPGQVAEFRDRSRAAFLGRTVEEQKATVEDAMRVLHGHVTADHPIISGEVIDLTTIPAPVDEALEAAARMGIPLVTKLYDSRAGRNKYILLGATPEQVRQFKKHWEERGQTPYAMPDRGIAGVVMK